MSDTERTMWGGRQFDITVRDPSLKKPEPRWEPLTKKHCAALYKLLLAVRHYGRNCIHIRKEIVDVEGAPFQLTKDQWTNFTKLRYHALAAKVKGKPGYWLFTRRAGRFLRGEIAVPKEVAVLKGHPMNYSQRRVSSCDP